MTTYVDLAREGSRKYRDQVLYTFLQDGESQELELTWAQLDLRARAVAAELQARRLAGQRVLLIYPTGLDYVVAFFACLYAGVIAVPAYPPMLNRSVSQLRNIIANASITVGLTNADVLANLDAMTGAEPALAELSWVISNKVPDERADDWQPPAITDDSVAFLQYTSGSTSTPKGVMLTHGNLMHCGEVFAEELVEPGARLLSWLPQYHDLGLFFGLLQPVYGGNPAILMSPMDFLRRPARWVQAISRYRVQVTAAPNFAYDLCARKTTGHEAAQLDLSCWQVAIYAAEPVRAATLDRFHAAFAGAGFRASVPVNLYGLAEGLVLSAGPKDEAPQVTKFDANALGQDVARVADGHGLGLPVVSAGRPAGGQQVRVVDVTSKLECDPGRVGEIWVAGRSVGQGYWDLPQQTQETFGARLADGTGPFLRTGDLGFMHDGQLHVTGRMKDVIIVRGENIYPQDLERTAEDSHPALRAGCVAAVDVGAASQNEGERIVIVQEVRTDWDGPIADSAVAVHRQIATDHGLSVDGVVLITAGRIPKTSSGKIRRNETRRMLLAGEFEVLHVWDAATSNGEQHHRLAPDTQPPEPSRAHEEIQTWLLGLLAKQFGIPPAEIDPQASFATLGLGSVQAVEMATQLADWLRFPVPSVIAWDHPTIEAIARHLSTEAIRHHREAPVHHRSRSRHEPHVFHRAASGQPRESRVS
jgi:acyl-CoA synthetase (AMP-forming)/AMP-acid ligase II/acyl carrier protein